MAEKKPGPATTQEELDALRRKVEALEADKREAEEKIRRLECRLTFSQVLLDSIPTPIFYKDEKLFYRGCNQAFQTFFGLKREEVVGKTVFEILSGEEAEKYHATDQKALEQDSIYYETVVNAANDERREVIVNKASYSNPDGSLGGIIGLVLDISEQKKAEEQVQQSEAKYRALFENSKDGIVRTKIDGRIMECNQTYADMLGYTEDELKQKTYQELTAEKYREMEEEITVEQIIKRGYTDEYEKEYIRKNGEPFPVAVRAWAGRDSQDTPIELWGIVRDITRRKKAKEDLDRTLENLKRSNRELEQFAYIASHDLQEPLRKIISFGERLIMHARAQLDEKSKGYLDRMTNAAERMQKLISSLLSYSRITTRGSGFSVVNLDEILEEVLDDMEIKIVHKQAKIETRDLPHVQADEIQMRQLFQNLVANGIKFSREGVSPHITIKAKQPPQDTPEDTPPQMVTIRVCDNGIGFESKYAERIFVPFKKLHGRNEFEGTGIGLSICEKIVTRHGGKIRAHGTPGQGSTFIFTLPLPGTTPQPPLPGDLDEDED